MSYNLEYVTKPQRFDEVVKQDGVTVVIDSKALFSVIGSEMDWEDTRLSQRFVFNNPNVSSECGCKESYVVFIACAVSRSDSCWLNRFSL